MCTIHGDLKIVTLVGILCEVRKICIQESVVIDFKSWIFDSLISHSNKSSPCVSDASVDEHSR